MSNTDGVLGKVPGRYSRKGSVGTCSVKTSVNAPALERLLNGYTLGAKYQTT